MGVGAGAGSRGVKEITFDTCEAAADMSEAECSRFDHVCPQPLEFHRKEKKTKQNKKTG